MEKNELEKIIAEEYKNVRERWRHNHLRLMLAMVSNYPGKVAEISLSPRRYRTLGVVVRSKKYVSPAARAYIDTVEEVVMQAVRERRL